jgi:hypothetical protein
MRASNEDVLGPVVVFLHKSIGELLTEGSSMGPRDTGPFSR